MFATIARPAQKVIDGNAALKLNNPRFAGGCQDRVVLPCTAHRRGTVAFLVSGQFPELARAVLAAARAALL
jgi:hypothetical protein